MTSARVAIVGAGIAGIACARALVEGGLTPLIFEKSRGVGGRLATRRVDPDLQFDHGAPCLTASDAGFVAILEQAAAEGAVAKWRSPLAAADDMSPCFVGLPGMSGLARHLCRGLDIRTGATVSAVSAAGPGWHVTLSGVPQYFDQVILTLPAPQILRLLDPESSLVADLSAVTMSPCLTLMAAFAGGYQAGDRIDAVSASALDLVLSENSKPGRKSGMQTWVAHATADVSRRHLECDAPGIAALLLPQLCDAIGRSQSEVVHAIGHRWRYALVGRALGHPFLVDPSNRLYLGGDWCLGRRAQDGWLSGQAIAMDMLSR